MTADRLARIRARAEAATEGPWETVPTIGNAVLATCDDGYWQDVADQIEMEADAEFIAHARGDVPALLADRDRLAAAVARVRALADEWEVGQAVNRRALKNREFMPYEPPNPADLRAAIEGTDS